LRAFESIITQVAAANESFEQATRRLIRLCDLAYGQRDYERLEAFSRALQSIPFKPAQDAGGYFEALCLRRARQYDAAADLLADLHQPRAVQTLATIYEAKGDYESAARLNVEALRRTDDAFTAVCASMQLAVIRSIDGDHAGALHGFQSLLPLVRVASRLHPHVYPAWCNALAVELNELGRTDEARAAVAVAIASSIARAYPEWQETKGEIEQAQPAGLVVAAPQREESEPPSLPIVGSEPPRASANRLQIAYLLPATRALNPRASPRAPPSLFGLR
jgi:tetratricopeptide (TPR) repeat protein